LGQGPCTTAGSPPPPQPPILLLLPWRPQAPFKAFAAPYQSDQQQEEALLLAPSGYVGAIPGVPAGANGEDEGDALPFLSQPPPFWAPTQVLTPVAIDVPSAPPLPADALRPDAPFWVRAASNSDRNGSSSVAVV